MLMLALTPPIDTGICRTLRPSRIDDSSYTRILSARIVDPNVGEIACATGVRLNARVFMSPQLKQCKRLQFLR